MLIGLFVLRLSSLLLSLVDLVLMEPLLAPFGSQAGPTADPLLAPLLGPSACSEVLEKKYSDTGGPFRFLGVLILVGSYCCSSVLYLCCLVLSCVVLCHLFDLTDSVKSSGRRSVFGRVVFLCCLRLFVTSSSGSFPWA